MGMNLCKEPFIGHGFVQVEVETDDWSKFLGI